MERKNVVRQSSTRKTQHDKLKAALAKKPTASYLNSVGISAAQLDQLAAGVIPVDKQKFLNERLVKNAKNRKRFTNNTRPKTVVIGETGSITYMDAATAYGGSSEWSTPNWFRTTELVDVSVIIPLYKSEKVIQDLIRSWPLQNQCSVEIIFVDDRCPKKSKEAVLQAWGLRKNEVKAPVGKIIQNSVNKGYGQACNAGAAVATGKHLIFLNADTVVTPGWIEPMIELFKDPKVGIVGNMHIKDGGGHNGTIDSAGSEWKWNDMSFVHIGRHCYRKQGINAPFKIESAPRDVLEVAEREMVTGCCFTIPAALFSYIGGFNPNYKIGYWEDAEICMNVRELGYKILFQPKSIIHHKLGHTSSGGHRYFGHNKQYFMNKWVNSHRLDDLLLTEARSSSQNPVNRILVRRSSAHGDALVAAGVCAGLKKKYPQARIMFTTMHPEVICENKYIDEYVDIKMIHRTQFDLFYNLDLCYEWRPNVNILTAYAEAVGVKTEDCKLSMNPQPLQGIELPTDYIVIHPGKTDWAGRDWPADNWIQIAQRLLNQGEKVVCVGKYSESQIPCTLDLRDKTSISQMAWVMSYAKAFLGIDSLPMHVAQVFDVPGISFFGCVLPELRLYSKKMKAITANDLSCLGCHHRRPIPSTVTKHCETGTLDCISRVTVDNMWFKVLDLLEEINCGSISLLG